MRREAGPGLWIVRGILGFVLVYPLSFGPACRVIAVCEDALQAGGPPLHAQVATVARAPFQPLALAMIFGPRPFKQAMLGWVGVWLPRGMTPFEWPEGFGWTATGYSYTYMSF